MIASWARAGLGPTPVRTAMGIRVPRWVLVPVALGVAALPLLKPSGPGNSSPFYISFEIINGVAILWAGLAAQDLRMPYALATGIFMVGGAIGSLAGPYPREGLLALVQDLVLLLWCGVLVNTARSPTAFKWIVRAWAWSSVAWALLLFAGVATGNAAIAGVSDRTGVRASLTFGDPNYAANYFFLSFMVVMATRTPRNRLLRLACCGALLGALALTGSNGGLIGAFGLLVLIGSVGWRTWSVAAKPLSAEFAAIFPRTSPLAGAVAGLAVSASYYQILHFRHVWTLLAIIAALFVWGRRRP